MFEPAEAATRKRMKSVRQRNTPPERALRRRLWARGSRYLVQYPILKRRRADIAFPRQQIAVFVDGCFWHACPVHGSWPSRNAAWWRKKLESNARRDQETDAELRSTGWQVIRVWEHEDMDDAADRVLAALKLCAVPRRKTRE